MKGKFLNYSVPILVLAGLGLALVFHFAGYGQVSEKIIMATLALGTVPLFLRMAKDVFAGHYGVDIIAITAILGSFFLKQYLAGGVIVLMLSGGEALEDYALRRARRELSALISRAPSVAHKKVNGNL